MGISQLTGGTIFDVQGFSVHDGPGCRTLIFLKGCTLHCDWCSNPEGIDLNPVLMYDPEKCIHDGLCVAACRYNALTLAENQLTINHSACHECPDFICTEQCLTSALRVAGSFASVDELFKTIRRDRQFWGNEGGITLTGGEPLLQKKFAREILKRCYDAYIHTAIETCGNVPWDNFSDTIPWIDFIYFDLKLINSADHRKYTGAGNELILENARRLASEFKGKLVFRMPVVPGINSDDAHINQVISFMKSVSVNEINILPLHHLGKEKYRLLNRVYHLEGNCVPNRQEMQNVQELFRRAGVQCYLG
jgi:pyruvate formate lyase activating enzyme